MFCHKDNGWFLQLKLIERHQNCAENKTAFCIERNLMATFKDPIQCFAPIEVVERLLEIRAECGFTEAIFLQDSGGLADCLDAYGFDAYAFSQRNEMINYGNYRAPLVPNGDNHHCSFTGH
jgi:hypothetical protein